MFCLCSGNQSCKLVKTLSTKKALFTVSHYINTTSAISTSTEDEVHCKSSKYRDIGTIHNCSNQTRSIAIISMYIVNQNSAKLSLDTNRILNNHLSCVMNQQYICIEITNHSLKSITMLRRQLLLSKFNTIYQVLTDYDDAIEYLS